MRRHEIYFLQRKEGRRWETVESAASASVLVESLDREAAAGGAVELRVVAGDFDESRQDWDFRQLFYVDRGAIDLALGAASADSDDGYPDPSDDTADERPVPGGQAFADAVRRADEDEDDDHEDRADARPSDWPYADDATEIRRPAAGPGYGNDDFDMEPPSPIPRFPPERRRSGRPLFLIGVILIALVLTALAAAAVLFAIDSPHIRPAMDMIREFYDPASGAEPQAGGEPDQVMPPNPQSKIRFSRVAPDLVGRWSPNDCNVTYIEFDGDGYVVGTPNQPDPIEVPVSETLTDDDNWYVRRSPDLLEYFQRVGVNEIQWLGQVTRAGFQSNPSDILVRCP